MSATARKLEQPSASAATDRRSSRRLRAETLPALAARLVAGPDVSLIDVSRGGARFESDTRLLPGSSVGLRLVQDESVFLVMARVVRSRVARLDNGSLRYESAVAFDKECTMFADDVELAPAVSEPTPSNAVPAQVDEPADVEVGETPTTARPRAPRPATRVLTFTAVVPKSGPDVRRILTNNRW